MNKESKCHRKVKSEHLMNTKLNFCEPRALAVSINFSVHFWTCSFLELEMLYLFCLFAVIGGKNVYLRLNMTGECDNKDSVWEMLQKEVLYSVDYSI